MLEQLIEINSKFNILSHIFILGVIGTFFTYYLDKYVIKSQSKYNYVWIFWLGMICFEAGTFDVYLDSSNILGSFTYLVPDGFWLDVFVDLFLSDMAGFLIAIFLIKKIDASDIEIRNKEIKNI